MAITKAKTTEPKPSTKTAAKAKAPKKQPKEQPKEQPKDTPVEAQPVVPQEVVEEKVVDNTTVMSKEVGDTVFVDAFADINKSVQEASAKFNSIKFELKKLETQYKREMKLFNKLTSRKKNKKASRSPSGFVKPTKISEKLSEFLGKDKGVEMARTEVTKLITAYVRQHELQDKKNGRLINPDTKLATLLEYTPGDPSDEKSRLSYFNLQRYLSPHFEKNVKPTV